MDETGKKLLWNTTNNFTHERFVHGAATSSNAEVYAYAAAKVKKSLEIAKKLNIKKAILQPRSPSCGVNKVYNGNFGL